MRWGKVTMKINVIRRCVTIRQTTVTDDELSCHFSIAHTQSDGPVHSSLRWLLPLSSLSGSTISYFEDKERGERNDGDEEVQTSGNGGLKEFAPTPKRRQK